MFPSQDAASWHNECFRFFASVALEPATVPPEHLVPTIGNFLSPNSFPGLSLFFSCSPPRHDWSSTLCHSFVPCVPSPFLFGSEEPEDRLLKEFCVLFQGRSVVLVTTSWFPTNPLSFHYVSLSWENHLLFLRDFCAHPGLDKWQCFIPVSWLPFHCFIHSTCKTLPLSESCMKKMASSAFIFLWRISLVCFGNQRHMHFSWSRVQDKSSIVFITWEY